MIIAFIAQIICFILVVSALKNERQIAVNSWLDFLARYMFALITQVIILKDNDSNIFTRALNDLYLISDNKGDYSYYSMVYIFRQFYNSCMCCIIPYYIMSIDQDGEEGYLDLIQNFTSLYIMCDID